MASKGGQNPQHVQPDSTAIADPNAPGNDGSLIQEHFSEIEHLYSTAPVGLCLMDTKLRFVRINGRLAAINGKAAADHIGRTLKEIIPEIAAQIEPIYRRVIETGQPQLDFEVHGVTPSEPGVERDWLVSYYPLKLADGSVQGVSTVVQEITERKLIEKALGESEEKFRTICENAPVIIDCFDEKGQCLFINREMEKTLGWTPEEIMNSDDPLSVFYPDPKARNSVLESIKKADGIFREYEVTAKDGSLRTQLWANFRLPNGTLISVGHDITDRKQTELKLAEANKLLEQRVSQRTRKLREAMTEIEHLKQQLEAENIYLRQELKEQHDFEDIIGKSDAIQQILRQVDDVASTDATVLLLGETGTGKELIAHAIHARGPLSKRPFVKVNCAALPATLIETELFGHEKGAFTGALSYKRGRFEIADRGTIFLDEIDDLAPELQAKLLKVLQKGEFERVGSSETRQASVRVLAASNKDLQAAIQKGEFREDLYYRLNVFPITLPPLRERKEDIPLLSNYFLHKYAAKFKKEIDTIPPAVMKELISYSWPGNVRELANIIERAVIVARLPGFQIDKLLEVHNHDSLPGTRSDKLANIEREHILQVLEKTNWIIEGNRGAAVRLGLNPGTLRSRMQKLGITRPL